jgi:hypothetical protein
MDSCKTATIVYAMLAASITIAEAIKGEEPSGVGMLWVMVIGYVVFLQILEFAGWGEVSK